MTEGTKARRSLCLRNWAKMVQGLKFAEPDHAAKVCRYAFDKGLLAETSGPSDEVVKLLPPLTISDDELDHGLRILSEGTDVVLS